MLSACSTKLQFDGVPENALAADISQITREPGMEDAVRAEVIYESTPEETPVTTAQEETPAVVTEAPPADDVSVASNPPEVDPGETPAPPVPREPNWTICSEEGGTCDFQGEHNVRYGANDSYVVKRVTGPVACVNVVFSDPIYGVIKSCYVDTNEF